jgi:hypothetical protein
MEPSRQKAGCVCGELGSKVKIYLKTRTACAGWMVQDKSLGNIRPKGKFLKTIWVNRDAAPNGEWKSVPIFGRLGTAKLDSIQTGLGAKSGNFLGAVVHKYSNLAN